MTEPKLADDPNEVMDLREHYQHLSRDELQQLARLLSDEAKRARLRHR